MKSIWITSFLFLKQISLITILIPLVALFMLKHTGCVKTAECDEQGNVKCDDQGVCILGFCQSPCTVDEDCEFGEDCIERTGQSSYCFDPKEPCKRACDEGEECVNGSCVVPDEDGDSDIDEEVVEINDDVPEEVVDGVIEEVVDGVTEEVE